MEPTEEDPIEELKSRPTEKPTIDNIGKGTDYPKGGLIEEPSRDRQNSNGGGGGAHTTIN